MTDPFEITQLALLGEAVECPQDVAVFVWDEDRTYVAANQAACRLPGKTRDEILRMKVADMTSRTKVAGLPYTSSVCRRA